MSDSSNSSKSFDLADSSGSSGTKGVTYVTKRATYKENNPPKLKSILKTKDGKRTFAGNVKDEQDSDTVATDEMTTDGDYSRESGEESEQSRSELNKSSELPSEKYNFFKFSRQNPFASMSPMSIILDLFALINKILTGINETYVNIKKAFYLDKVGMGELQNNPSYNLTAKSDNDLTVGTDGASAANKDKEINQDEPHTVTFNKENPPNKIGETLGRKAGELGTIISGGSESASRTESERDSKNPPIPPIQTEISFSSPTR